MNDCPHPECTEKKPVNMYACRRHWFSLPKRIRDKIWDGYANDAQLWLEADREAAAFWGGKKDVINKGAGA